MTDLADWVLAQIAADESAARAAYPSPWRQDDCHVWTANDSPPDDGPTVYVNGGVYRNQCATAAHIARHDPARVLADRAAKRAIVTRLAVILDDPDYRTRQRAGETLRLLAQPYADRPGWDPAWKVET